MTLILALPTEQGIVLASDTQYTSGEVRSSGPKLYALSPHAAWAGAGEVALIQRVQEAIADLPTGHDLSQLRDTLARIVKQSVQSLLELDVLTDYLQGDPAMLLGLHPGDCIFAEYANAQPLMLHVAANGTPEWFNSFFASGNGANFAYALLQKYQNIELTLEQAILLAYRVIDETIQVGAYGLDYPIDIWLMDQYGLHQLDANDFEALAKVSEVLRTKEIELLQSQKLRLKPARQKQQPQHVKKTSHKKKS